MVNPTGSKLTIQEMTSAQQGVRLEKGMLHLPNGDTYKLEYFDTTKKDWVAVQGDTVAAAIADQVNQAIQTLLTISDQKKGSFQKAEFHHDGTVNIFNDPNDINKVTNTVTLSTKYKSNPKVLQTYQKSIDFLVHAFQGHGLAPAVAPSSKPVPLVDKREMNQLENDAKNPTDIDDINRRIDKMKNEAKNEHDQIIKILDEIKRERAQGKQGDALKEVEDEYTKLVEHYKNELIRVNQQLESLRPQSPDDQS